MSDYQSKINAIHNGQLVDCTKEEYESGLRTYIQNAAGKYIDQGDPVRSMIALSEVRRLDDKFKPTEDRSK